MNPFACGATNMGLSMRGDLSVVIRVSVADSSLCKDSGYTAVIVAGSGSGWRNAIAV